jgi:hypothetical protein
MQIRNVTRGVLVVRGRACLFALAEALTDSKIDRLKNLQVWDSDFILTSL